LVEKSYQVWSYPSPIIGYSKSTVAIPLANAVKAKFHIMFSVPLGVSYLKVFANGNAVYDGWAAGWKDETYEIPLGFLRDGENVFEAQVVGAVWLGADVIVDYTEVPPTPCQTDADCPSGYRCENGVCVPVSPPWPPELTNGLIIAVAVGILAGGTYLLLRRTR
jgi:Cys-rich repeat protein